MLFTEWEDSRSGPGPGQFPSSSWALDGGSYGSDNSDVYSGGGGVPWSCPTCTLRNAADDAWCAACGHNQQDCDWPGDSGAAEPPGALRVWNTWREAHDPKSGKTFWYDTMDPRQPPTSQWGHPGGPQAEAAAQWTSTGAGHGDRGRDAAERYLRAEQNDEERRNRRDNFLQGGLAQAARAGDPEAQWEVGGCFLGGFRGVDKDVATAAIWLARAAGQGHPPATNYIGTLDAAGKGRPGTGAATSTEVSDVAGLGRFLDAARGGFPPAMFNAGLAYCQGAGASPERSYAEALRWFATAAEHGHAGAKYNLAVLLYHGRGVQRDRLEAFRLLLAAAEEAEPHAKDVLKFVFE